MHSQLDNNHKLTLAFIFLQPKQMQVVTGDISINPKFCWQFPLYGQYKNVRFYKFGDAAVTQWPFWYMLPPALLYIGASL